MNLDEIRQNIDEIDVELQKLFEDRMNLCLQVAKYKMEHNMQVFQSNREMAILNRVTERANEGMAPASRKLFTNIMSISSQLQQKMMTDLEEAPVFEKPDFEQAVKIGCQGTLGANSETATKQFFPNKKVKFYPSFAQVFEAVESGEIQYGVLPIYNSTSGTVTQTVDLMRKYNFFITAMNHVEVTNCLAVIPGTKLEEVKFVYSHPQALSQCSDFIDRNHLVKQEYGNTATAAKMIADEKNPAMAAICSEDCATLNGLEILVDHISNVVPNTTQFICITKEIEVANDASVISVMLTLSNEPGSLSRILNKFLLYNLDMTKIESRPIRDGSFDVVFHIDFKGNLRDRDVAAFLNDLCKNCKEFKLLGNSVIYA